MTTQEKTQTILHRYERTRLKRKKVLKTTLINTSAKQMRKVSILLTRYGIKTKSV